MCILPAPYFSNKFERDYGSVPLALGAKAKGQPKRCLNYYGVGCQLTVIMRHRVLPVSLPSRACAQIW